jgi:hypothetical protein
MKYKNRSWSWFSLEEGKNWDRTGLSSTIHAQWKILLDDEFLAAYEHGILI